MRYVFIHGLGQNSSSWDKTITLMSNPEHILCPDLFEILDHKEPTYANLYRSFSDYCNGISGALNLCGVSLGAILALNYAISHPEKVQSLVLIGAQYKMPKTLLKFQNIVFRFMPESSFKTMGIKKKDVIMMTNSMLGLDFSERLKEISCAALIICGEKDTANKKSAKDLAETIPCAEFHIIDNAGHQVNTDAPNRLAPILNAFWQ